MTPEGTTQEMAAALGEMNKAHAAFLKQRLNLQPNTDTVALLETGEGAVIELPKSFDTIAQGVFGRSDYTVHQITVRNNGISFLLQTQAAGTEPGRVVGLNVVREGISASQAIIPTPEGSIASNRRAVNLTFDVSPVHFQDAAKLVTQLAANDVGSPHAQLPIRI